MDEEDKHFLSASLWNCILLSGTECHIINYLLNQASSGRTREYWPSVVFVWTSRQYSPVRPSALQVQNNECFQLLFFCFADCGGEMAGQEYKRHVLNTLCSSRYVRKEADILFTVNSSPIDEPGNWLSLIHI